MLYDSIVQFSAAVIGFKNTTFIVTEGVEAFVEVCVRVFEGLLEKDVNVTLLTVEGTAVSHGTEPDFESLSMQLTFTSATTDICHKIIIINDAFYENSEDLTVWLSTNDPDANLEPDSGTITILDEEGTANNALAFLG